MDSAAERKIRRRATSIVMRHGKVLLLREPGEVHFQLPGGGVKTGESAKSAAARELYEESGLVASCLEYIGEYCDFWGGEIEYWGQVQHVFRVTAEGEVALSSEHREFTWWNRTDDLPIEDYVRPILCNLSRSE